MVDVASSVAYAAQRKATVETFTLIMHVTP
jgi:hypothetical protein